jgi:hypothetical protein
VAVVGSREVLPDLPGVEHAVASSRFIGQQPASSTGDELVILDDGFGWWPCASAVETGIAAGWESITLLIPAASFGGRLPPEGHVQLMARLRGAPLEVRPVTGVDSIIHGWVTARNLLSGQTTELAADLIVVVGERRARAWEPIVPTGPGVHVIGDAVVPRRVHHAIAEGRRPPASCQGLYGALVTSERTSRSAIVDSSAEAATNSGFSKAPANPFGTVLASSTSHRSCTS